MFAVIYLGDINPHTAAQRSRACRLCKEARCGPAIGARLPITVCGGTRWFELLSIRNRAYPNR